MTWVLGWCHLFPKEHRNVIEPSLSLNDSCLTVFFMPAGKPFHSLAVEGKNE